MVLKLGRYEQSFLHGPDEDEAGRHKVYISGKHGPYFWERGRDTRSFIHKSCSLLKMIHGWHEDVTVMFISENDLRTTLSQVTNCYVRFQE